jgi:hypothetical protein
LWYIWNPIKYYDNKSRALKQIWMECWAKNIYYWRLERFISGIIRARPI